VIPFWRDGYGVSHVVQHDAVMLASYSFGQHATPAQLVAFGPALQRACAELPPPAAIERAIREALAVQS
jgi:hypothetical protein